MLPAGPLEAKALARRRRLAAARDHAMGFDRIFADPNRKVSDFSFNAETAEVFEDMLALVVTSLPLQFLRPLYRERYNFFGVLAVK